MLAVVIACGLILLAVVVLGRKLSLKIGKLHAEFAPNGGSSMRDAIDRIEDIAAQHTDQIAAVHGRLDKIEQQPAHATAVVVTPAMPAPAQE
jgi:hypothetical protein